MTQNKTKNMRLLVILSLFIFQPLFAQLQKANYSIKSINANTKYSDYGTSYFGPNRVYFASSKRSNKKLRNKNDAPLYDLFKGFVNNSGEINYVKRVKNNFSTQYNESNVSFTPDLKYVYFTQNNNNKGKYIEDKNNWINLKIYRANVENNGEWSHIISLPFNNDSYSCAHPTISEDGRILFFTSDMPGTLGDSDIFWVTISMSGEYGEPQNIGPHVNSISKENFPFVDGNILYFSSDRPGTKGGLDMYMVELDDPYAEPTNLGAPINSPYDDFCFVINRKKRTGFFSSNRPEGKGEDDIYTFVQKTKIKSCSKLVKGVVKDSKTDLIIPQAIVSLHSSSSKKLLATFQTKEDGKYEFTTACKGDFKLIATKKDYKKSTKIISINPYVSSPEYTLLLDEIFKPKIKEKKVTPIIDQNIIPETIIINRNGKKMLKVEPIYFVLDEYYITKISENTLAKVARIIEEYPNIIIEFGAHTDSRGSESYNLHLSKLRAKEVKRYLTALGVPSNRLIERGYGESQLVNNCRNDIKCTEAEHLQNRRTEFVIIQQ